MIFLVVGLAIFLVATLAILWEVHQREMHLLDLVAWHDAREPFFADLYQQAILLSAGGGDLNRFKISGGVCTLDGTMLNHQTLLELLAAGQGEERAKLAVAKAAKETLAALEKFEQTHPVPEWRPETLPPVREAKVELHARDAIAALAPAPEWLKGKLFTR